MPRVTVMPAEGRRVRLPGEIEPMADEWREVERDTFVARRLADGDLIEKPASIGKKGEAA